MKKTNKILSILVLVGAFTANANALTRGEVLERQARLSMFTTISRAIEVIIEAPKRYIATVMGISELPMAERKACASATTKQVSVFTKLLGFGQKKLDTAHKAVKQELADHRRFGH